MANNKKNFFFFIRQQRRKAFRKKGDEKAEKLLNKFFFHSFFLHCVNDIGSSREWKKLLMWNFKRWWKRNMKKDEKTIADEGGNKGSKWVRTNGFYCRIVRFLF
jgi:hypothetical protein